MAFCIKRFGKKVLSGSVKEVQGRKQAFRKKNTGLGNGAKKKKMLNMK